MSLTRDVNALYPLPSPTGRTQVSAVFTKGGITLTYICRTVLFSFVSLYSNREHGSFSQAKHAKLLSNEKAGGQRMLQLNVHFTSQTTCDESTGVSWGQPEYIKASRIWCYSSEVKKLSLQNQQCHSSRISESARKYEEVQIYCAPLLPRCGTTQ